MISSVVFCLNCNCSKWKPVQIDFVQLVICSNHLVQLVWHGTGSIISRSRKVARTSLRYLRSAFLSKLILMPRTLNTGIRTFSLPFSKVPSQSDRLYLIRSFIPGPSALVLVQPKEGKCQMGRRDCLTHLWMQGWSSMTFQDGLSEKELFQRLQEGRRLTVLPTKPLALLPGKQQHSFPWCDTDIVLSPAVQFLSMAVDVKLPIVLSRAKLLVKGSVKHRPRAEGSSDAQLGILFLIILHASVYWFLKYMQYVHICSSMRLADSIIYQPFWRGDYVTLFFEVRHLWSGSQSQERIPFLIAIITRGSPERLQSWGSVMYTASLISR